MARSATAGNLFITVGGDVTPLRAALTAGKSVLNEFGSAAIDVQAEVTKAFADMAGNAPAAAKQLEQSYSQSFAQIRKNAQAVLSAPTPAAAAAVINATGASEAAAAAEAEAAALRMVADAATRADAAALGNNTGTRAYAIAAEAAAQQAAGLAAGLRSQAQVLGQVQAQLVAGAGAQQKFAANQNNLTLGANNGRVAQMEYMHIVRGTMDQLAAGAPITQVLAMHMGMLSQAVSLSGASMGTFGKIMSGPWGLAITAGVSLLAMLAGQHDKAKKSAEEHRDAEATLVAYINGEKVATDALLESLVKLNDQESKSIDLKDQAIRKTIDLTKATLDHATANKAVLQTQLAQAQTTLANAKSKQEVAESPTARSAASSGVAVAQAEVDRLQTAVNTTGQVIAQATAVISDDIVKLARNLATHVDQANDLFDKKQAELEAKYRGTPSYAVDKKGNLVTTLHGGMLNQPGLSDASRQQLTQQLASAEHDLNVQRQRAVDAARELDKAEVGQVQSAEQAATAFKKAVIGAEGTGQNRMGSSASGFGQFMPQTWLSYFNKAYPGQSALSQQQKLDLRSNREVANGVIELATKDYEAVLKAAGQQITEASLYTVHLLGSRDAKKLLSAPAGQNTSDFLSAAVLRGNPFLKGDAGGARTAIATRIGDSGSAVSSGTAAIQQALKEQADKDLQQQSAYTSERDRLNEQILAAVGQLHLNYEAEAQSALRQVDAEHQAEADKISSNLAEGKYGAATSKLAQARAASLQLANDQLAQQRTTNVLVKKFNDQLQEGQKDEDQRYQFLSETLQYEAQIARTADARRQIELDIVDALYEHKKNVLDAERSSAVDRRTIGARSPDRRAARAPAD
jgi:hypothetical protein